MTENSPCPETGLLIDVRVETGVMIGILDVEHFFVGGAPASYTGCRGEANFLQPCHLRVSLANVTDGFEVELVIVWIHQKQGAPFAVYQLPEPLHNYSGHRINFSRLLAPRPGPDLLGIFQLPLNRFGSRAKF